MRKNVKFLAVLSAVMVMAASSAFAQFSFGVKASATLNNILEEEFDGEDASEHSNPMKFGFNAGVFGEYMFSDNMGVAAELLFAQQGRKDVWKHDNDNKSTYTLTTNNINLPIMFRYYPMRALSVEIGPQFGFCFGVKDKDVTKVLGNETETSTNWGEVEDNLQEFDKDFKMWNRFNVGAAVGANYNFDFGLFVGARYTIGLTDLFYQNEDLSDDDVKSKTSVISVSVGYRF